jgi:hypothetical protein
MKIILTLLIILFPVAATAQNQGIEGNNGMAPMMLLMQEMDKCMAQVDQAAMASFEKEAEQIDTELEQLCSKGDRDKAQKKAIAFGKKVMKNSAIIQMKKCAELTKGILPADATPNFDDDFDFSDEHVCDKK